MRRRKKKQRFGVECVGSGGVPWRGLFSLHTPGTEHASTSRQSDVSSLRGVYFCCVVCGGQNISFIRNIVQSELWSADRSHGGILACQGLSLHAFSSAKDTEMSQTAYSAYIEWIIGSSTFWFNKLSNGLQYLKKVLF